jgi:phosphatidylglycerophosphate synthase
MAHNTWTHRMARVCVRPLVGSPVTPNHLTTVRLALGLGACAALAAGTRAGEIWGGVLWVLSAFFDRADGELARLAGRSSPLGHAYDYATDVALNALFFVAVGVGLRHTALGRWALVLGLVAGVALAVDALVAEQLERRDKVKTYPGTAGFDFDDVVYLFGPAAWLGWLLPLLVGTAAVAPFVAFSTWRRWAAGPPWQEGERS